MNTSYTHSRAKRNGRKKTLFLLLAALSTPTLIDAQICRPDSILATTPTTRFSFNGADAEVIDTITGLIWQRCAVGQTWNAGASRCEGAPIAVAWQQALTAATQEATSTGQNWRLPNIKELASIVELQCYGPAFNLEVFPNAPDSPITDLAAAVIQPLSGYWSATPSNESTVSGNNDTQFKKAWFLDAYEGYGATIDKQTANYVRLVRTPP